MVFGKGNAVFYAYCFWGWPLMIDSIRGGVLGLLTFPLCVMSTAWRASHLHLIVAFSFCNRVFDVLGWWGGRPASLVLGAIYLFFVSPMQENRKGEVL